MNPTSEPTQVLEASDLDTDTIDLDAPRPLRLLNATVTVDAVDYNGHMTEAHYHVFFGQAVDRLLLLIGVDQGYVDAGHSYYNVEAHVRYLREVGLDGQLYVTTQILGYDEKRIHMLHSMLRRENDELLATAEQMYLHVDSKAGRAVAAPDPILSQVERIGRAHARLDVPASAGCTIRALAS